MKIFIKSFVFLPTFALLASCAVDQRQALNMQDRNTIKSSHVLVNSTQREIRYTGSNWFSADLPDPYSPLDMGAIVKPDTDYNAGEGVLAALVVSGIQQHSAGKSIKEISSVRSALNNFNFVQYFNSQLSHKLKSISWLKVGKQEVRYNVKDSENKFVNSVPENTTLFIGTVYALSEQFRELQVNAYVKLVKKQTNGKSKTLYSNTFYFYDRLPRSKIGSLDQNRILWIRNNGAMLKEKLSIAGSLLSDMIVLDLSKDSLNSYSDKKIVNFKTVDLGWLKGPLIARKNDYYIISNPSNGYIYAVNSEELKK